MSATLTVSIVNYKTPALVVECIDSLKQFAPTNVALQIAVVDNDSGDGSLTLIGAAHPDVRLVDAGANLGFAAGNNLVLRDCRSDYVLLLNSDALVEAGTLDRMIRALDQNPQVGAVSGRVVNASDGADQDYPCRFPTPLEMVRRALRGPQFPAEGQEAPVVLERLHGACMMIRGSLLISVGVLDEGFFMYDEDVDWCTRAGNAGWSLWLLPDARVLHHGGRSSGRAPSGQRARPELSATALRMRYELRRSRYRLYRKHRALWELCLLKLFTDLVMMLGSARAALLYLAPERREGALALLRSNLRVMGMNPFAEEAGRGV
ncbi:glycosyltransferase family 2 protein [Pseudomonas sp. Gutcm_11s]|uniref:glycosyltransferase family 2 protein n=1 Tax=Pseudomonas sp. Gutcm_11s TaxID=3026088 RepID=UPI00235ED19D|nr:glycosyltransferase family 2 protein [Pseudomonas sp. Gutcm_11s]MDD0841201.1 glycosyltransferase family 2 protein [Pseudomonas sp. Gutcm_11s]